MKQVEVTILGQSYLLACPDDGREALLQAVALVDREMSAIRDAGKVKARERMAVLAALNLAYRLVERNAQPSADRPTGDAAASAMEHPPRAEGHPLTGPARSADPSGRLAQADLESLIQRLDDVLAEDGRLL